MPYKVAYRPSKDRPKEPWVKLDERGRIVSRHRTKAKALASIRAYYAHLRRHYLANARSRNPIERDPTRTLMIRQQFSLEMRKAFRALAREVKDFMVEKDALGLKEKKVFSFNVQPREYEFRSNPQKLEAFREWFRNQIEGKILSPDPGTPYGEPWTTEYVRSAYRRGHLNAYLSSRSITGSDQSAESFLRSSFGQPETLSKIQLLGLRAYEELRGVTSTMATEMNRILARGLAEGRSPQDIADIMVDRIGSLARSRAMSIARTEVIYAHAEGQLDAFSRLGISRLGVKAEWSTAGDDRVCPDCLPYEGRVFELEEARGMIPLHPNCRCSWIPAAQVISPTSEVKVREIKDEEYQSFVEKRHLGQNITPDEKKAALNYQTSGYRPINAGLREGEFPPSIREDMEKKIRDIDSVIAKSHPLEEPILVFRGGSFDISKVSPGMILEDKAYVSTSTSWEVAASFNERRRKSQLIAIRLPAGTRGMGIEQITGLKTNEYEFVLPRGARFRVTGEYITKNRGVTQSRFAVLDYLPPDV